MNRIKTYLRITELDTLATTIVRLYQAAAAESETFAKDSHLTPLMAKVKELSESLTLAIKRDRAESSLDEADVVRDEVFGDLFNVITGYASFPFPEKRAAGKRLLLIFQKYGIGVIRKPYSEESSLIESMLGDFSAESAKADIALLPGIAELLSSLRSAQDSFHATSDAYTAAKLEMGDSATAIKKELLGILNGKLRSLLSAIEQPDFADFIAKCAAEIDKANATAEIRSKQTAAKGGAESAAEGESQ